MISSYREAVAAASEFSGKPLDWFSDRGFEGLGEYLVGPLDEEREGSPRFKVSKNGRVVRKTVQDYKEIGHWLDLDTTHGVSA